MSLPGVQHTVACAVEISGIGLHSGRSSTSRLVPAPAGEGITFRRTDLPGAPVIRAALDEVASTSRGVVLGREARVCTVEHLLSAARGIGVDNLRVETDGEELPAGDGSARIFVEALSRAGSAPQQTARVPITLDSPLSVVDGAGVVVAAPAGCFRVTYLVVVDDAPLPPQLAEFREGTDDYATAIGSARTWGFAAEVEALRARGLALGASLANVLAVGPDGFINEPRFPNEMARHKILDIIGDLALLGRPLHAHVVAVRAGHRLHVALAREIAVRAGGVIHA